MLPSTKNQIRALSNLILDISAINEEAPKAISVYFSKTGLKTEIINLLIDMDKILCKESSPALHKQSKELQDDCITYLKARIKKLEKPNIATESQLQLNDIVFACQEVAKHKLTQWSEKEAQEVGQFQAESLPTIMTTLKIDGQKQKELQELFEGLKSALKTNDFDRLREHADKIAQYYLAD